VRVERTLALASVRRVHGGDDAGFGRQRHQQRLAAEHAADGIEECRARQGAGTSAALRGGSRLVRPRASAKGVSAITAATSGFRAATAMTWPPASENPQTAILAGLTPASVRANSNPAS